MDYTYCTEDTYVHMYFLVQCLSRGTDSYLAGKQTPVLILSSPTLLDFLYVFLCKLRDRTLFFHHGPYTERPRDDEGLQ